MSRGHYSWSNGTADKFVSQPRARNYSEKPNNLIEYHTTVHSEQIFFLFAIRYLLYQTSRCLKCADKLTYHFNASMIFLVETTQEKKHEVCFDLYSNLHSCFHF